MIHVSVIVPHFNQSDALLKCLASLQQQTFKHSLYEIIVADNNTPNGIDFVKNAFPMVKFIKVEERGAACARNAGMKIARGDVFAFIDADCEADPEWLKEGLKSLDDTDIVGGRVDVTVRSEMYPSPVEAFEQVFSFRQKKYIEVDGFSVTANILVPKAIANAVGPFKNGLSEDVEWCHRARALGFRLAFNDKSVVRHPARRQWGELVSKWDRMIGERWNGFGGRKLERRILWIVLAIATALSLVPHILRVLTSDQLTSVGARVGAIGVLARIRCWRAIRMITILFSPSMSSD